ncbi:MAG: hypothetical protein ACRD1Y_04970 [Terriglobales bacterium]
MSSGALMVVTNSVFPREGALLKSLPLTVAWGLELGLAASLALPQLLTALFGSMLFSPPPILAADAALVGAVAVLAALSPALRAMRADPVSALRYE